MTQQQTTVARSYLKQGMLKKGVDHSQMITWRGEVTNELQLYK
jgi:hypothetical protein